MTLCSALSAVKLIMCTRMVLLASSNSTCCISLETTACSPAQRLTQPTVLRLQVGSDRTPAEVHALQDHYDAHR